MGTIPEQIAALISFFLMVAISVLSTTLLPGLQQAQEQIGTAAWHGTTYATGALFLGVGLAILSARLLTTRGQRWQYRVASPLGGVFTIGAIGMEGAFLCLGLGWDAYFTIPVVIALVVTVVFLLWAEHYRLE